MMKTDLALCAEIFDGDLKALDKLMARYEKKIALIAESRFRRSDMGGDLSKAVRHTLTADGNGVLVDWCKVPVESITELMDKLAREVPLLDEDDTGPA
jgi:hypothetical protein